MHDSEKRRSHRPIFAGATAALVTVLTGVINIGRSFDYDESFTYALFIKGGSVHRALTTQWVFNNHQMFSAIQAVGWRMGFRGETSQRLGPVLCGAAVVFMVVWYSYKRAGGVAAAAAATYLILNPTFMSQVRLLRGYALATFGVVLVAIALQRSWTDPRKRWAAAQFIGIVLAITAHAYSAITLMVLIAAAAVVGRVRRNDLVVWALAAATAALIQWPLVDDMLLNAEARGNRFIPAFPEQLLKGLLGASWVAIIPAVLLGAAGTVAVARTSRRHGSAVATALPLFTLVALTLWAWIQPFDLYARFFISTTPFVAILIGIGASRVKPYVAGFMIGLLVLGSFSSFLKMFNVEPQFRDAAQVVDAARANGVDVCSTYGEPLWSYTAQVPLISGVDDFGNCGLYVAVLSMNPAQVQSATKRFGSVWKLDDSVHIWGDAQLLNDIKAQVRNS